MPVSVDKLLGNISCSLLTKPVARMLFVSERTVHRNLESTEQDTGMSNYLQVNQMDWLLLNLTSVYNGFRLVTFHVISLT